MKDLACVRGLQGWLQVLLPYPPSLLRALPVELLPLLPGDGVECPLLWRFGDGLLILQEKNSKSVGVAPMRPASLTLGLG